MADKQIGDLPLAPQVTINTLLAVEQSGRAMRMTGAQFAEFGKNTASQYIEGAKKDIKEAVTDALNAKEGAEAARDRAEAAAASAENSAESSKDNADTARQYSGKPPIIQDGRWWTWNAERQVYIDTGESSRGNLMYATFFVDLIDGSLYMVTDDEYTGPRFHLVNGELEVVLNNGK